MTRLYFLWYNEVKTFFSIKKLLYKKSILNDFSRGLSPYNFIYIADMDAGHRFLTFYI
uniref:Uncharacterized protein n=1 Tax=Staphylococcus phage 184DA TaxID=3110532 RepID=A0AAU6MXS4_9CAUD